MASRIAIIEIRRDDDRVDSDGLFYGTVSEMGLAGRCEHLVSQTIVGLLEQAGSVLTESPPRTVCRPALRLVTDKEPA